MGAHAWTAIKQARRRKDLHIQWLTNSTSSGRRWSRSPGCSCGNIGKVPALSRYAKFAWTRSNGQIVPPRGPKYAFSASWEADASWSCGESGTLDFQQEGLFLISHSGETFLFSNSTKYKIPGSHGDAVRYQRRDGMSTRLLVFKLENLSQKGK